MAGVVLAGWVAAILLRPYTADPHHPSGEGSNWPLRELARAHGILPHRCARCGQRQGDWTRAQDDSSDPQWLGFQCGGCGGVQGLSRGQVLRRIRQAARVW